MFWLNRNEFKTEYSPLLNVSARNWNQVIIISRDLLRCSNLPLSLLFLPSQVSLHFGIHLLLRSELHPSAFTLLLQFIHPLAKLVGLHVKRSIVTDLLLCPPSKDLLFSGIWLGIDSLLQEEQDFGLHKEHHM